MSFLFFSGFNIIRQYAFDSAGDYFQGRSVMHTYTTHLFVRGTFLLRQSNFQ